MPNINIKEYDKTSAGVNAYSNFSVVVPGLCGNENITGVFDENGIYECDSLSDFVTNIGLKSYEGTAATPGVDGVDAEAKKVTEAEVVYAEYKTYTFKEAYNHIKAGKCICTARLATTEEQTEYDNGKKAFKESVRLQGVETETSAALHVYTAIKLEDHAESTKYVVLNNDATTGKPKTGSDKIPAQSRTVGHYGNQVAYELLRLGYTVLYKKMTVPTTGTSIAAQLEEVTFWECLKDKGAYDFRYIVSGLISDTAGVNAQIADVANFKNEGRDNNGRGDCIAFLEIDSELYKGKAQNAAITSIIENINGTLGNENINKFDGFVGPYVEFKFDREENDYDTAEHYNGNRIFPASFYYLACAARARKTNHFPEWFAIAGFNRGLCDFEVVGTGCKFGEIAVNTLAPRFKKSATEGIGRAVNIIACIRGTYYLYGNRTAEKLGLKGTEDGNLKASHFLNIRELCCTLKKKIYVACRKFTFDPNSDALWINYCNEIAPTLEKMKANEGVENYQFEKVATSLKATLCSNVHIKPVEAVEDFDIGVYLEDSIDGTSVSVTENM